MKIDLNNPNWLEVSLQKDIDWGNGVVVNLPNGKKITIHLSTRDTACVQYYKVDVNGNEVESVDSFVVNDKMEWYDQDV